MMIRRPVVAGKFYEAHRLDLEREVASYMGDCEERARAKAIISPHAGFPCSGPVAGKLYSRIRRYETYVILGPNHRGFSPLAAVYPDGAWSMPMGEALIDSELASTIVAKSSTATSDELPHQAEHSIEVQLPFIQRMGGDMSIVPICVGHMDFLIAEALGRDIAAAIAESEKDVLLVASTDMSHYIPHQDAVRTDRLAIHMMLELDARGLYDVVRHNKISMCGMISTVITIVAANVLGASSASLVSYMTSGETCGGKAEVVGYAGVLIE
ncbi:AmmeMemoRadiSam system protein B [bacterium]|nr:AmmeMemoRadiSam system protein B [bacterium]